jgi:hypothetical protein
MDSHQPFICSAATEFQDDPKTFNFPEERDQKHYYFSEVAINENNGLYSLF